MISINLVILIMFLHWLGDFKFQSNEMALKKSKEWGALIDHVMVYTFTVWVGLILSGYLDYPNGLFVSLTFLTHFITDAVTSRINSKLWFIDINQNKYGPATLKFDSSKRHWFFVSIGFDQWIHLVTLLLSWKWIIG